MTQEIRSDELPTTPMDPVLSATREGKINVAMIGLCGCWGCTLSFLDMDERIVPLLTEVTIHRSSLTDIKRITQRCAIGFIEGGVANEENIETLRHFRANCDILISVGACAVWGGVPAMRNVFELKDCLSEAYVNSPTAVSDSETAEAVLTTPCATASTVATLDACALSRPRNWSEPRYFSILMPAIVLMRSRM